MTGFEHALLLLLLLTVLCVLGRWLPWPMPITQVVGACVVALWFNFPRIELDPEFFFFFFVPPLLFADGWLMPLRDFMAAKRQILSLATGLVVFTTLAVGLVAHWIIPTLPLALAFALGAVVSPTDAVAVAAITERLKVPPRLTAILKGESLMNDATGLVAFKFALAAMLAGTFSLRAATLDFFAVAIGGTLIGFVISWTVGRLRDLLRHVRSSDVFVEVTLSLMTPYAAYLVANALGFSSILAIVTAGLYAGWRDPVKLDAETRQTMWAVWSVLLYWLNGLAFVLLGLQFPTIVSYVRDTYTPWQIALSIGAVSGAAILARLLWVFPSTYLPFWLFRRVRCSETPPPWQHVLVIGWAGMRGTVTLAAALSLPVLLDDGTPLPGRHIVIFLAFAVTLVTLLLQGMTLAGLIRKLRLRSDDVRANEERLARIAAVEAGLTHLRAAVATGQSPEETAALGEVLGEYEQRLAELTAEGETRASAHRRRHSGRQHRHAALHAERHALDDLWRRNVITDETHRPLQQLLDHEETMLKGQAGHAET